MKIHRYEVEMARIDEKRDIDELDEVEVAR